MLVAAIKFIIGLILLIGGARSLVFGATYLSYALRISPLIVGLAIVSLGTSTPEIAVSAVASYHGEPDLVIGNILGSNIFNILLVLGLSAVISPLTVKRQLIRWDVPLMIILSLILWGLAAFGMITWWEGILFIVGIFVYLWHMASVAKKERDKMPLPKEKKSLWLLISALFVGIILLGFGSDWLVESSTTIARGLGVSELFIGLTIVAIGTSLPEVASALVAIYKGEKDLAVGAVIGSNIFNILLVLGIATFFSGGGIPVSERALTFDFPIMVGVAIATLPIFLTGHKIARWEGILFLFYYVAYLGVLYLQLAAHAYLELFLSALGFFFLPLTAITLIIALWRHFTTPK